MSRRSSKVYVYKILARHPDNSSHSHPKNSVVEPRMRSKTVGPRLPGCRPGIPVAGMRIQDRWVNTVRTGILSLFGTSTPRRSVERETYRQAIVLSRGRPVLCRASASRAPAASCSRTACTRAAGSTASRSTLSLCCRLATNLSGRLLLLLACLLPLPGHHLIPPAAEKIISHKRHHASKTLYNAVICDPLSKRVT